MSTIRTHANLWAALAAGAVVAALLPAAANAQANCQWYAATALKQ